MIRIVRSALVIFSLFSVITGVLYPFLLTGAAQLVFRWQANGSLIKAQDGREVGSLIIGQSFSDPKYFWGRPSATAGGPYNSSASGGSNYSVLNLSLLEEVRTRLDALHAADPDNTLPVPVDLVTSSASGLDPHISPAAAYYQVSRIARLRNLAENDVRALVDRSIEKPFLGIIGEPRINVLKLNLALDSLQ